MWGRLFIATELSSQKLFIKHKNKIRMMTDVRSNKVGVPLTEVVAVLQKFADPSLAASWDNVGLLVEPSGPKIITQTLLTNDLTEDVMQEAIDKQIDLIISYHPPIFNPLKSLTSKTWKERIIIKCLENKIALYSPHTSFDSIQGGVNDWLLTPFREVMDHSEPIQRDERDAFKENGMGRICTLRRRLSVDDAVALIKQHLKLQHVRLALARRTDGFVNSIAVCAGAGATVLKGVTADLYITGEMLHHDILEAIHHGTSVILTNHSDSERGYLEEFARILNDALNNSVKVNVSKTDTDPLKTV